MTHLRFRDHLLIVSLLNTKDPKIKKLPNGPLIRTKNILRQRFWAPGVRCPQDLKRGQAWTGHCAVAQAPPSTNTGAPWPLRNFLTCALRRKITVT